VVYIKTINYQKRPTDDQSALFSSNTSRCRSLRWFNSCAKLNFYRSICQQW